MPPDKELDGVHESKGEEREGGSDEVEEGEAGEDQVCCQLVIFRVTVRRGEKISLFFSSFWEVLEMSPVYECEESGKGHEKGDRGEGEVGKSPELGNPTENFDLPASDRVDCTHKRHLPGIEF